MNSNSNMVCRLCKSEKKLIKRSHIIPDFMYKGLFNDKHFIADFDLTGVRQTRFYPNGYYDSNILCADCDNRIIGGLENYAKMILFGGKGRPENYHLVEQEIDVLGNRILHVKNIDYKRFKLFVLSIIWRASISKQSAFQHVNLEKDEEKIRKMIFDLNPGDENEFPFGIILFAPNDICPTQFITNPFPVADNGNLSFIFTLNGMVINYKVSGDGDMDIYNRLKIKENNTIDIIILNQESTVGYIDTYMKGKFRYDQV